MVAGRSASSPERDAMFAENIRLVHHVLKKFTVGPNDYDDLYQVGCLGLLHAVDRFDPSFGYAFSTYACRCISGYIMQYKTRGTHTVRVPENLVNLRLASKPAEDELTQRFGREPTREEAAHELGVTPERLAYAYSLRVVPSDSDQYYEPGESDHGYDEVEDELTLESMLKDCTDRERAVAHGLIAGRSYGVIADDLGISKMEVSRIVRRQLATKLARFAA